MNLRSWQRDHRRLTVQVVQAGQNRFFIPLSTRQGMIPVYGSLEDAQARADGLSGCEATCNCPPWSECEAQRPRPSLRDLAHRDPDAIVAKASLPKVRE